MAITLRRHPEINRSDSRYALRYAGSELSKMEFRLRRFGQSSGESVTVCDFTNRGFGIRFPPKPALDLPFKPGERVELVAVNQSETQAIYPCSLAHIGLASSEGTVLGLRRIFGRNAHSGLLEMRVSPRFTIPPTLGVMAYTPHTLLFGHLTWLRLMDINLGMGYCLETDDPLFLGTEGMEIALRFPIPHCQKIKVMARILWVQPIDKNRLRIGVQTWDIPFDLYQMLCRYLMHAQVFTPEMLREAGFYVRHVQNDIRFRQVNSLQDYAEVLRLRLNFNSKEGIDAETASAESMALSTDGQSRILGAWHGQHLIGTLSLYFAQDSSCEVEMKGLAIAENYHGTDVLQGLYEQASKAFLFSDAKLLTTFVAQEFWPFYQKLGFRLDGEITAKTQSANSFLGKLSLHKRAILKAQGLSLGVWNLTYGGSVAYLLHRGDSGLNRWERCLAHVRLLLGPLAKKILSHEMRSAYLQHLQLLRKTSARSPASPNDWTAVPP